MDKINRVIKKIVYQCMGYRPKERILIVTDDKLIKLAQIFYEGIKKLDIEVSLICFIPRSIHGEEPPQEVASALRNTDISFLITSKSLSHTRARQIASQKYGVRIASMPGINLEIIQRSLDVDYKKLQRKVKKLAEFFNKGNYVEIKTDKGTNLSFSIKNRKAFEDNGIYIKRGDFGNLPAGEVCIAPVEGTAQGILIVDGSFAGIGKLEKPIEFEIKNGYVQKCNNLKLKKILSKLGRSALNIAEFGIGLNPKAKITGNVLEDEKATNTAHIALGDNLSFGGRIKAKCHLDGVFLTPSVWIDGRRV